MSNRRIGFQERNNQTVRRPLSVFYGTQNAVDPTILVQDVNQPSTDSTLLANVDTATEDRSTETTERSQITKKNRSADKKETIRQTYYMEPAIVEAIKIMEFDTREGISTMMNRLLKECIPDDILKQAEKNLLKRADR